MGSPLLSTIVIWFGNPLGVTSIQILALFLFEEHKERSAFCFESLRKVLGEREAQISAAQKTTSLG